MATYTDPTGPGQIAESATDSNERSDNAVDENKDNVAPEFKEGGDKPVMQATRYIVETADAGAQMSSLIPTVTRHHRNHNRPGRWPPTPMTGKESTHR